MNTEEQFDSIIGILRQHDKRFDQIDKRFEQIDKRFEQVDKRFEQLEKAREQDRAEWREARIQDKAEWKEARAQDRADWKETREQWKEAREQDRAEWKEAREQDRAEWKEAREQDLRAINLRFDQLLDCIREEKQERVKMEKKLDLVYESRNQVTVNFSSTFAAINMFLSGVVAVLVSLVMNHWGKPPAP